MGKRKKYGGHDETTGYMEQQRRRAEVADDRGDDSDLDDRLADGYDLMAGAEDDKETISPAARAMMTFKDDLDESTTD